MRVIFFLKILKIEFKFTKCKEKLENIFFFWDNCIKKCYYKFSLLRREYLLSAVNGLTNSPTILHIIQREFLNLICLGRDQLVSQRICRSDLNIVSVRLPCYFSKGSLKENFLDIYIATSFRVDNKFNNISAMRVIFFRKSSKFNVKLENAKKKLEKVFRFWHNCIWKCSNKLPLLGREHLSSVVNRLTGSRKILDIAERSFFQLNCLHRDQ